MNTPASTQRRIAEATTSATINLERAVTELERLAELAHDETYLEYAHTLKGMVAHLKGLDPVTDRDYKLFLEDTVDDTEYNAWLDHTNTPTAENY